MIQPTVGRIVEFIEAHNEHPNAAIVVHVHNDRLVNLVAFDQVGHAAVQLNTPLRQPEDPRPEGNYCQWMPYQVKKDHGSESGERAAGTENIGDNPATDADDPGPTGPVTGDAEEPAGQASIGAPPEAPAGDDKATDPAEVDGDGQRNPPPPEQLDDN